MPGFFNGIITPGPLLVDSDNIIELADLERSDTGAEIDTGATVTFQITDTAGSVVQSSTAMTALGSGGVWRGDLPDPPDTLALRAGESYIVSVTVVLDTSLEQSVFTVGKSAADGVGFYNWFGAFPAQVVDLFPGAVLDDFGPGDPQSDQHTLSRALTSAATRVVAACPPLVYAALHQVDAELIEENAVASQADVVVSLPGVIASSLLLFRNWSDCPVKPAISDAVDATTFTTARVTDPADADYRKLRVTFNAGSLLAAGETVHATYKLDTNTDDFRFVDLADLTVKVAAAEVGSRLYRTNASVWSLVEQYQAEGELRLTELRESKFVPNEIRAMALCEDIETTGGENVASVQWARVT